MSKDHVLQPLDVNIELERSPPLKKSKYNELPSWSLNNDLQLSEIDQGVSKLEYDCDSDDADINFDDEIFTEKPPYTESFYSVTPEKNLNDSPCSRDVVPWCRESSDESCDFLRYSPNETKNSEKTNYFDLLSDEVVLQIIHLVPKRYLFNVSLVCKRFKRLTEDETLWTKMDVSNRTLKNGALGQILSRQVVVLRLAKSEIMYPIYLQSQPIAFPDFRFRLMFLDLSMSYIIPESLVMLFNKCQRLKKVSLEHVPLDDEVLIALSGNKDIEVINFAMCEGIKEKGLEYLLSNCRKIRELNLGWANLNASSITYVCEHLPSSMDRINLSGCRKLISDGDVALLVSNCPNLRELDLSDCTGLTGEAVKQITVLQELQFLALSRCYAISYKNLLILKKIAELRYLDIHGGFVSQQELNYIQENLGTQVNINRFKFSSVARPTVGMKRSSIWNVRVRD